MKQYTSPELKEVKLTVADIIQTSGNAELPTLKSMINGKSATDLGSINGDAL